MKKRSSYANSTYCVRSPFLFDLLLAFDLLRWRYCLSEIPAAETKKNAIVVKFIPSFFIGGRRPYAPPVAHLSVPI